MSVKLRLTRLGRKKRPYYRIVAVDSRRKRDGSFIDRIGYYHPLEKPVGVNVDAEKALKWLRVGALPSDTVLSLLKREGVWLRFRLEKRGLPEAQINQMMSEWFAVHKKEEPAPKPVKAAPESSPSVSAKPEEAPADDVRKDILVVADASEPPAEPTPEPVLPEPEAAKVATETKEQVMIDEGAPVVEDEPETTPSENTDTTEPREG